MYLKESTSNRQLIANDNAHHVFDNWQEYIVAGLRRSINLNQTCEIYLLGTQTEIDLVSNDYNSVSWLW